jgi:Zn-finger nucleic acid-binding protein
MACGRELGLEPILDPSGLVCPNCDRALAVFAGSPGKLFDCDKCGGQLVEHPLLQELLERREICGAAVPRRAYVRESALASVHYVPCPACRVLMNRHNFGGSSGVVVDVCKSHGVWFDAGELPRVLEFVVNGGLARARRKQIDELEQARRGKALSALEVGSPDTPGQSSLRASSLSGSSVEFSSPPAWKTGLWDDAKEAIADLLHEVGGHLGRK